MSKKTPGWVEISNVCQTLSLLAYDFVSHDTLQYIKPMRIKLSAAAIFTGLASQFQLLTLSILFPFPENHPQSFPRGLL